MSTHTVLWCITSIYIRYFVSHHSILMSYESIYIITYCCVHAHAYSYTNSFKHNTEVIHSQSKLIVTYYALIMKFKRIFVYFACLFSKSSSNSYSYIVLGVLDDLRLHQTHLFSGVMSVFLHDEFRQSSYTI